MLVGFKVSEYDSSVVVTYTSDTVDDYLVSRDGNWQRLIRLVA